MGGLDDTCVYVIGGGGMSLPPPPPRANFLFADIINHFFQNEQGEYFLYFKCGTFIT